MNEKEIRQKIKNLCEEYKEQSWVIFRYYYNELKELTDQLVNEKDINK